MINQFTSGETSTTCNLQVHTYVEPRLSVPHSYCSWESTLSNSTCHFRKSFNNSGKRQTLPRSQSLQSSQQESSWFAMRAVQSIRSSSYGQPRRQFMTNVNPTLQLNYPCLTSCSELLIAFFLHHLDYGSCVRRDEEDLRRPKNYSW